MRPRARRWALALLAAALLPLALAEPVRGQLVQDPLAPGGQVFTPTQFVPGELIVRFEPDKVKGCEKVTRAKR